MKLLKKPRVYTLFMIVAGDPQEARRLLLNKILECKEKSPSRYGEVIKTSPSFLVMKKPEGKDIDFDIYFWNFCGETYLDRVENSFELSAEKLRKSPFTRRVSIPLWKPKDHLCKNPPAVTEISLIQLNGILHLTAYVRSLDVFNYFEFNSNFLNFVLDEISERTGLKKGTAGMVIGVPHIYSRDLKRAEKESGFLITGSNSKYNEIYGVTEFGTHIVEDYISSGWHSVMESIYYSGNKKKTEWGELFDGQAESKFLHRVFLEVKNPYEEQLHDKAPFSRSYGVEYAHNYMIHAKNIDTEVKENILKEGETYTYAERARYCEKDDYRVDQLYTSIQKLKRDKHRRDCYVGISREWDLDSDEPPCLRGYQLIGNEKLKGVFYMRSNDAFGALHANIFAFSTLTQYVAELTGFKSHEYYHFSVDMHIYTEFLDPVKEILEPDTPTYKIDS